jgi:chromosome segregation ATPase
MNALSEKSWKRVSDLSDGVSLEKKILAEQRAKFSERVNTANQAIARLNEFAKSLEGKIKKYEDMAAGRMQKNEDAISDASKRIDSLASALEKSGSFSKGLDAKMGRLDSQAYSEKKALLEKVKSLESGLRDSSLAISGLKKQLAATGSSKSSADKRISGLEGRLKELQAADSGMGSRIEKQYIDFQNIVKEQLKNDEFRNDIEKRLSGQQEYVKGLESALSRVVKMIENVNFEDKRLEARFSEAKEEIMRKLSEENRQLHQKTGTVSSVQEETAKRLAAMENSLRMLAEKAAQSEKQFRLDVDGLKAQLAEAGKGLSKTRVRSAELKDYMSSMVKAEQDSAGAEITRLRGEIAVLKKDITEWQQEQARLYDLLKED